MRVLVCGGRDYATKSRREMLNVIEELNYVNDRAPIKCIIEGGASGADTMAFLWATFNDVDLQTFDADWGYLGKKAGPIRNQEMIDEGQPDVVVAFPGGNGTNDMVNKANIAGVKVYKARG